MTASHTRFFKRSRYFTGMRSQWVGVSAADEHNFPAQALPRSRFPLCSGPRGE